MQIHMIKESMIEDFNLNERGEIEMDFDDMDVEDLEPDF